MKPVSNKTEYVIALCKIRYKAGYYLILLTKNNNKMEYSNCCTGSRWNETDICSECGEHAEFEEMDSI